MVEGESWRVLSSEDLRIVAPRMAALEAAIMVKSKPVRPRRTSLYGWLKTILGIGEEVGDGISLHCGRSFEFKVARYS